MRFAFKTANQYTTWADILAVWKEADGIELYESGWLFDHFYPIWSPQREADLTGDCLEGWTMLGGLAAATSRLRLGTIVTGVHYRHPAVLANMAATVDIISGGRLELGIGAGWNEQESGAYGIPLGSLRERFDRFDEACEVLIGLLSNETTDFTGTYYELAGARCEPKGPQRPHPPILIGGTGEKRTLRAVARYAQSWDASGAATPEELAHKRAVLASHCEDVGRDPSEITITRHVWVGSEHDAARVADEAAEFAGEGLDVAIMYLAPPHTPAVLAPLAEALAPLRTLTAQGG
jgi:F420-dependent oxidoreductase-like protein